MSETSRILGRQAEWQERRIHLSWPEKIRLAEAMLSTLRHWHSCNQPRNAEIKSLHADLNQK